MKVLIQRAFLRDTCHYGTTVDRHLNLTLGSSKSSDCLVQLPKVRADSLNPSRAIAELIGEARYLLAMHGRDQSTFPKRARTTMI
jgi:hypothetical protein